MNISYCPTYDLLNCSQFDDCYICNVSTAEIERQYNILPYCTKTQYCISNNTYCDDQVYFDHCIVSKNLVKICIGFLILFFYVYSHKRITTVFEVNRYNNNKRYIILFLYSIINLFIPIILIFTTYLIYLEYFSVCILSVILTCCCIPPIKQRQHMLNRFYTPYTSLSQTMPITPPPSPIETSINSIPEENFFIISKWR